MFAKPALSLVVVTTFLLSLSPAIANERPNVILILADDLALGDLARNNGGKTRTPNLDRLADQSVRFTSAYSGSCVCAPARASLLTGRYPHRTGIVTLNMNRYPKMTRLKLDEVTIADRMRNAGYKTALIGKWHCGLGDEYHPMKRGFDEFEGFTGSEDLGYFDYRLEVAGKKETQTPTRRYLTDDLSARAVEYIRRNHTRPFFLHLAHYAPHRPLEAPKALIDFYLDAGFEEPIATIHAMIEVMDRGIGELLNELDRLKIADKTIVIFASDNGPDPIPGKRFNADGSNEKTLRGMKYETHEGGIRVPLWFRWAEQLPPRDIDTMIHFVDVMPTILNLCDVRLENALPIDGDSFAPQLRNFPPTLSQSSTSPHQSATTKALSTTARYWQWNRGEPNYTHNAAIRLGKWKLMRPFLSRNLRIKDSTEPPILFDLHQDPGEANDRSNEFPNRARELDEMLQAWCDKIEADRLRN